MESKYLYTFRTILETGSFKKAAARLNYAQSTVTMQMQLLEQELSVKLFEKIGRRMVLTQSGKDLLPLINTVLEAVEQMENYGKRESELTGTLCVAMPETILNYQMQPVIERFREQAPGVRISLQMQNCYVIRELMMEGRIDLGVHYNVGSYGSSVMMETLSRCPLCLIASPKLSVEERDFTSPGQRRKVCLLTVDRMSVYHKRFHSYLSATGIIPDGEMEIESTETVKRCVASNLGVACLPRFTVERELEQGTLVELQTGPWEKEVDTVCTWHKNKWMTPAMELFMRLVKDNVSCF